MTAIAFVMTVTCAIAMIIVINRSTAAVTDLTSNRCIVTTTR